ALLPAQTPHRVRRRPRPSLPHGRRGGLRRDRQPLRDGAHAVRPADAPAPQRRHRGRRGPGRPAARLPQSERRRPPDAPAAVALPHRPQPLPRRAAGRAAGRARRGARHRADALDRRAGGGQRAHAPAPRRHRVAARAPALGARHPRDGRPLLRRDRRGARRDGPRGQVAARPRPRRSRGGRPGARRRRAPRTRARRAPRAGL
ncbi:MAG: hypothetical protein AVDCRST_MAG85-2835, partial [uncultured Solirubrobacteraceae bacterium]